MRRWRAPHVVKVRFGSMDLSGEKKKYARDTFDDDSGKFRISNVFFSVGSFEKYHAALSGGETIILSIPM